jgi:hypothetical protein
MDCSRFYFNELYRHPLLLGKLAEFIVHMSLLGGRERVCNKQIKRTQPTAFQNVVRSELFNRSVLWYLYAMILFYLLVV